MAVGGETDRSRLGEFVFSMETRSDGACVVRCSAPWFEFEGWVPDSVEALSMADRWRKWVRETRR